MFPTKTNAIIQPPLVEFYDDVANDDEKLQNIVDEKTYHISECKLIFYGTYIDTCGGGHKGCEAVSI